MTHTLCTFDIYAASSLMLYCYRRSRTMTKWNERYPEWRDDPKVLVFAYDPTDDTHRDAVLHMVVMNASKTGKDELFAHTMVPLRFVMDQRKHSFWLRLCCPSGMIWIRRIMFPITFNNSMVRC